MKTYKGYTIKDYENAKKELAKRVFNLFDKDNSYNNNKGDSLLWNVSFNAKFCAIESIDYAINNNVSLPDAIIEVLGNTHKGILVLK